MHAYVGLGGNTGDVLAAFAAAGARLARLPGVARVRMASVRETVPVGPVARQPRFLNSCAEIAHAPGAEPSPRALLEQLLEIERALGRDRAREVRQGPRPVDLDLLVWGDRVVDEPSLVLPHPRLAGRLFALEPLAELAGEDLVIPGAGRLGDLLARIRSSSLPAE